MMILTKFLIKTKDSREFYVDSYSCEKKHAIKIACVAFKLKCNEIVSCVKTDSSKITIKLVKIGFSIARSEPYRLTADEMSIKIAKIAKKRSKIDVNEYSVELADAISIFVDRKYIC